VESMRRAWASAGRNAQNLDSICESGYSPLTNTPPLFDNFSRCRCVSCLREFRTREANKIMKCKLGQMIFLFACTVVAGHVAFAQKVSTKADDKYSFAEHKHYAWRGNRLMTRQNPDTNEVMDIKIVKAVNQFLAGKGFVEVKEKPDFYIFYDGGGNVQLGAGGASQVGGGPTTSADIGPDYGMGNGPTLSPTTWMKVNGVIEFHIVDAATQKPVWETTYNKHFRDPDKALKNMDKEVNELVTKSFKDFPPKEKK
jgi:hypothetical protein